MQLTRWDFNNLRVPMMMDTSGKLWCTSKQLCEALGIKPEAIRKLAHDHKDELEFLSVTESHAKDFLKENKSEFGIKRVKQDMSLWSEDDMITIAVLSKSSVAKQFRKDLVKLIKEQARKSYVTRDEFNEIAIDRNRYIQLYGETSARLDRLEQIVGVDKTVKVSHLRLVN